jgi:uncharacterized membrane protein
MQHKYTIYLVKSTHYIPKRNILHQFKNNILIQLSSIKQQVYTSITNGQFVPSQKVQQTYKR